MEEIDTYIYSGSHISLLQCLRTNNGGYILIYLESSPHLETLCYNVGGAS